MFFPDRMRSINPADRVLEIGPGGGVPHPRPDVFLEKKYETEEEAERQRSFDPVPVTDKPIVYYEGTTFPFSDKEFDYVICSQVLDHIPNIELFVSEMQRVASKGYLEFGTIYFDIVYNHPTHVTLLLERDGTLLYLPKKETVLHEMVPICEFFRESQMKRYNGLLTELRTYIFQGFEWFDRINLKRAESIADMTYDVSTLNLPMSPTWGKPRTRNPVKLLARRILRRLS